MRQRPQAGTGPLVLALGLRGSLSPEQAGSQILFRTHSGATALRYGQLSALDATGRRLPAHMQLVNGTLQLQIDDSGARYPLRIDPFIQQGAKLTGGGESGRGCFGDSVALSADGNTALIGGTTTTATSARRGCSRARARPGPSRAQSSPAAARAGGDFGSASRCRPTATRP